MVKALENDGPDGLDMTILMGGLVVEHVVPLGETDTDSRAGRDLYPQAAQSDSDSRR